MLVEICCNHTLVLNCVIKQDAPVVHTNASVHNNQHCVSFAIFYLG